MPLPAEERARLKRIAFEIRQQIVDVTAWSGGAHIGGALSMTDILTILYFKYLNIEPAQPDWPDRDRFVLSKGHGGVGHAVALAHRGYFPKEDLREFNATGSKLGMHLDSRKAVGVDVSTGSMGHGLSQAVGLALAARVLRKNWRTYCIVGDGESNEGSIWEAAMAAHHYKLANLTAFCDRNHMMIDGLTEEVMGLEPLAAKWTAFGWQVRSVNGHDFDELADAVEFALANADGPVMIIADTVKGKGVDFMENDPAWHYGGLGGELLAKARASLERMA